jgi:GAF domain-containing protein
MPCLCLAQSTTVDCRGCPNPIDYARASRPGALLPGMTDALWACRLPAFTNRHQGVVVMNAQQSGQQRENERNQERNEQNQENRERQEQREEKQQENRREERRE